jgi:hypothetical protein
MHLAYIRTRTSPTSKATPEKDWMELRAYKRLAHKNADRLKAIGITEEEYIKILQST